MPDTGLDAELQLDITRALDSVGELERGLGEATSEVVVSFDLSGVQALSDAVDEAKAGLLDAPVTIDTSEAEAQLSLFDADVEEPAVKPVVTDTTEAVSAVDAVQEQVEEPVTMPVQADTTEAQGSVDGLHESVEGFSASAEAATGNAAGLVGMVGKINPTFAAGAAAATALAGATHEFYEEGVTAVGAAQRFELVVGDMREELEQVNVAGLNTTMEELGLTFGSTSAAMENSNSKLFAFAKNAGASDDAAASFVKNVEALAARAISLNPNLGTLSDVMEQMGPRLARGGRFASEFNLALTPAEITARAMADTGKTLTSELTVQEKAMAGAEIAAQRYGDTLASTVAEGSQNAIVQQRSLKAIFEETLEKIGTPLVAPMFDLIRATEPDVALLGQSIGDLAGDLLPLLTTAMGALESPLKVVDALVVAIGPALGLVSTIVDAIPGPVLAGAAGFFMFRSALSAAITIMPTFIAESIALESAVNPVAGLLAAGAAALAIFSGGHHEAAQASQELVDALEKEGDEAQHAADAFELNQIVSDKAAQTAHDAGIAYSEMNDAVQHGTQDWGEWGRAAGDVNEQMMTGESEATALHNALVKAGAGGDAFGQSLIRAVDSGKLNRDQVEAIIGTMERLHNEYNVSAQQADAAGEAQAEQNDVTAEAVDLAKEHADAVKREDDAVKAYIDTMHASMDPWFAMLDAVQKNAEANDKVTAAQTKLTEAVKAHGPNSKEAAEATKELTAAQTDSTKSALDLEAASAELEGQIRSGKISVGDATNTLHQWVAQGVITQATADAMAAKFQYVGATADNLQGKNIAMSMSLDDPGVLARLQQVHQLVQTLTDGTKTIEVDIASRGGGARMAGGPVYAGETYTVGERGTELFTPNLDGYIVPNDVLQSMARQGAPAGGNAPFLNIEHATIGDERVIGDLDWWATTRGAGI